MAKTAKPDPETVKSLLRALPNVSAGKLETLWSAILSEMLTLYYPPMRADTDDQMLEQVGIALRAYVIDLADFDGEALREGWREVRRTHKVARWPAIQEIRDRCAVARDRRREGHEGAAGLTLAGLFRTGVDARWIARCHGLQAGRTWLREFWGPAPAEPECQCPAVVLEYFGLLRKEPAAPAQHALGLDGGSQTAERPPEGLGL